MLSAQYSISGTLSLIHRNVSEHRTISRYFIGANQHRFSVSRAEIAFNGQGSFTDEARKGARQFGQGPERFGSVLNDVLNMARHRRTKLRFPSISMTGMPSTTVYSRPERLTKVFSDECRSQSSRT